MKAIYIHTGKFNSKTDLEKLNKDLKDVYSIESEIELPYENGRILIVSEHTRADKLKKLNEIANERANNNGL
jgi:hypothetical protein